MAPGRAFGRDLWAIEHGGIDVEGERIAAALTGQELSGCAAALSDWPRRARTRRPCYLSTLARLDIAATWGVDELERRDPWIEAGLTSEHIAYAATFAISDDELFRWVGWERRPEQIAHWRRRGWTAAEAQCLSSLGLPAGASAEYRAEGLDVDLICHAYEVGLGSAEAGAWWRAGFDLHTANELVAAGVDVELAARLKEKVGRGREVVRLVRDQPQDVAEL